MRRWSIVMAALVVLLLDYAALDDITTGTEPGFVLEWIVLASSVPVLAALARAARPRAGDDG